MSKTVKIFELTAPYNNQYQGDATRLLFVCSVGMLRSPTAADVATGMGFNARSCGTEEMALIPLTANLIMWADVIIFMSPENYIQAMQTFENTGYEDDIFRKCVRWSVSDDYNRGDPNLRSMVYNCLKTWSVVRSSLRLDK